VKTLALVLLVACGGTQPAPHNSGTDPDRTPTDSRTAIERRRDDACEKLAARNTACAVADAKNDLATGKVTQKQFDADTSQQVQAKLSQKFVEKCQAQHLNSYQVRVYEVCMREETECDPLLACLTHVNDPAASGGSK